MRIVQISDRHLSPREPRFDGNWRAAAAVIVSLVPDLVIHTDDLALDGADDARGEAELAHAIAAMAPIAFSFCPATTMSAIIPTSRSP